MKRRLTGKEDLTRASETENAYSPASTLYPPTTLCHVTTLFLGNPYSNYTGIALFQWNNSLCVRLKPPHDGLQVLSLSPASDKLLPANSYVINYISIRHPIQRVIRIYVLLLLFTYTCASARVYVTILVHTRIHTLA